MELANQTLGEALEKEANDLTKRISHLEEDIGDEIKKTKKELKEKMDNDCGEIKRKVELETNEIRYDDWLLLLLLLLLLFNECKSRSITMISYNDDIPGIRCKWKRRQW